MDRARLEAPRREQQHEHTPDPEVDAVPGEERRHQDRRRQEGNDLREDPSGQELPAHAEREQPRRAPECQGQQEGRQAERGGRETPGPFLLLQRVGPEGRQRADAERREKHEPVVQREREQRQRRNRGGERRHADEEGEPQNDVGQQEPALPPARSEPHGGEGEQQRAAVAPRGPGQVGRGAAPVPRRRTHTARRR